MQDSADIGSAFRELPGRLPDNSCAEARMRLEDGRCSVTGQVMGLAKGMGHVPDCSVRGTESPAFSAASLRRALLP